MQKVKTRGFDFTTLSNIQKDVSTRFKNMVRNEDQFKNKLNKSHQKFIQRIVAAKQKELHDEVKHDTTDQPDESISFRKTSKRYKKPSKAYTTQNVIFQDYRRYLPKKKNKQYEDIDSELEDLAEDVDVVLQKNTNYRKEATLKDSEIMRYHSLGISDIRRDDDLNLALNSEKRLKDFEDFEFLFNKDLTTDLHRYVTSMRNNNILTSVAIKIKKIHECKMNLNELKAILAETKARTFMKLRNKEVTIKQVMVENFQKNLPNFEKIETYDEVTQFVKKYYENGKNNDSITGVDPKLVYKKSIADMSLNEILDPKPQWQSNYHCLRSLYNIKKPKPPPEKNKSRPTTAIKAKEREKEKERENAKSPESPAGRKRWFAKKDTMTSPNNNQRNKMTLSPSNIRIIDAAGNEREKEKEKEEYEEFDVNETIVSDITSTSNFTTFRSNLKNKQSQKALENQRNSVSRAQQIKLAVRKQNQDSSPSLRSFKPDKDNDKEKNFKTYSPTRSKFPSHEAEGFSLAVKATMEDKKKKNLNSKVNTGLGAQVKVKEQKADFIRRRMKSREKESRNPLLFLKRIYRETDETVCITDEQFKSLYQDEKERIQFFNSNPHSSINTPYKSLISVTSNPSIRASFPDYSKKQRSMKVFPTQQNKDAVLYEINSLNQLNLSRANARNFPSFGLSKTQNDQSPFTAQIEGSQMNFQTRERVKEKSPEGPIKKENWLSISEINKILKNVNNCITTKDPSSQASYSFQPSNQGSSGLRTFNHSNRSSHKNLIIAQNIRNKRVRTAGRPTSMSNASKSKMRGKKLPNYSFIKNFQEKKDSRNLGMGYSYSQAYASKETMPGVRKTRTSLPSREGIYKTTNLRDLNRSEINMMKYSEHGNMDYKTRAMVYRIEQEKQKKFLNSFTLSKNSGPFSGLSGNFTNCSTQPPYYSKKTNKDLYSLNASCINNVDEVLFANPHPNNLKSIDSAMRPTDRKSMDFPISPLTNKSPKFQFSPQTDYSKQDDETTIIMKDVGPKRDNSFQDESIFDANI